MKYTGQFGAYIMGIPARDLTTDEWNELTEAQRQYAIDSGLYVELTAKEARAAKAEAKAAAVEPAPTGG